MPRIAFLRHYEAGCRSTDRRRSASRSDRPRTDEQSSSAINTRRFLRWRNLHGQTTLGRHFRKLGTLNGRYCNFSVSSDFRNLRFPGASAPGEFDVEGFNRNSVRRQQKARLDNGMMPHCILWLENKTAASSAKQPAVVMFNWLSHHIFGASGLFEALPVRRRGAATLRSGKAGWATHTANSLPYFGTGCFHFGCENQTGPDGWQQHQVLSWAGGQHFGLA